MKIISVVLVLVFCLVFVGCSGPVEEVKTFINERNEVVAQMCLAIDAGPTEAGIDDARKIFKAKKADLKAKWDALSPQKLAPYGDLLTMLAQNQVSVNKMFDEVRKKNAYRVETKWDLELVKKFYALKSDFDATFK